LLPVGSEAETGDPHETACGECENPGLLLVARVLPVGTGWYEEWLMRIPRSKLLRRYLPLGIAVTGLMALGISPAQAADKCTELGNGRLCVAITPVNQQGAIQVIYTKTGGAPIYGHLAWQTPGEDDHVSPDISMTAGHTYYHTWPTWVGPGWVEGVIWTDRYGRLSTGYVKVN